MSRSAEDSSALRIDQDEAPAGYFAVLKSEAKPLDGGNICRACDWRQECDGLSHRCMPYAVFSCRDGGELKRNDGCSVVFKRKRANTNSATNPV